MTTMSDDDNIRCVMSETALSCFVGASPKRLVCDVASIMQWSVAA